MNHITKLPKNLCYIPTGDFKENGKPVMALDVTQTYVSMIPSKLNGVDRVYVKKGQLRYVAPDYQGQIYVLQTTPGKKGVEVTSVEALSTQKIAILKYNYRERQNIVQSIFNQSFPANRICDSYPPEEMYLPSRLSFFWDNEKQTGTLNARKTWLRDVPNILNITRVIMPNSEELQNRMNNEKRIIHRQEIRSKRRDFGYIRHMTICGELDK